MLLLQESLAGRAAQVQHRARRPGERVHRGLDVGVELLRVMARVVLCDDLLQKKPESETELVLTFALLGLAKRVEQEGNELICPHKWNLCLLSATAFVMGFLETQIPGLNTRDGPCSPAPS